MPLRSPRSPRPVADRLDGRICCHRFDHLEDSLSSQPGANATGAGPDSIAYLIYTRALQVCPRGWPFPPQRDPVAESLDGALSPGRRSQWHSLAFDVSVCEIWVRCYPVGASWWCPSRWRVRPKISMLLVSEQVGVLSQTPSGFYALQTADALVPELGRQLKLEAVIFAGEALEPQRLRTWLDDHPGSPRLLNLYGTTETTVHASFREIRRRRC